MLFPISHLYGTRRSFCHVRGALSCSSMSVGPSERRERARAHRVLRLSRSLPPLQISSPEPLKRRTRHGVIRLVEQRVGFQREVVASNLQLSKIKWPSHMLLPQKVLSKSGIFSLALYQEAVPCSSHGPPPREVPFSLRAG